MDINILVDGLGWEISRDHSRFDFLDGARGPLETILGFSSGAIPTILTGRMPEEHGVWNLFQFDPRRTDFPLFAKLGSLAPLLDRSRVARRLALEANRIWTGFEGYYQAYEVPSGMLGSLRISERKNLYQAGGTGECDNLFDAWNASGRSWISASWRDGARTDEQVLAVAREKVRRTRPDKVFVYLAGYDAFGHRYAGEGRRMVQEAGRIADLIQGFLSYCRGLDSRATLSVFSDHGMLPLRGTVDVSKALGARTDRKPWTVLLDATMARFWWNDPRPGDWAAVQDAMKGLPGHFLSDMELEVHGIRFGGAYGELVWLADPGIQIVPSHMASVPLGGMHGYDPVHPLMKASFLSTGRDEPAPEAIWELREWMEPSREVHEQPMVLEVSR